MLDGENLMSLPFARRAEKVVFLPQSLPQGVHLHVLESIIVAQRASGGRDGANSHSQVLAIWINSALRIWRCTILTSFPAASGNWWGWRSR